MTGQIVLVGTPIGNLGDLSPRAVEALRDADLVYCEDTRRTRKLLTHAGLSGVRLRSLHRHNEAERSGEAVRAAAGGTTVAVVSDAGMPGISDPPSQLVAEAAAAGVPVTVVPGPSAALCALVASGLPTDRFCFEGFLPRSGGDRRDRLAALANGTRTVVLFEAPTRVAATLDDLVAACGGERQVAVARELTKVHEEVWRGTLADAAARSGSEAARGEVVLVLAGADTAGQPEVDDGVISSALGERLASGERRRGAVDDVADLLGVPRRRVYQLALSLDGWGSEPESPSGVTERNE